MRPLDEAASVEPTAADEAEDRALGTDDEVTRELAALVQDGATPRSVDEWRRVFAGLDGAALREVGMAANNARFVRRLQGEGLRPKDVHGVLIALAQRFAEVGQRGPDGGLYDWDVLVADGARAQS